MWQKPCCVPLSPQGGMSCSTKNNWYERKTWGSSNSLGSSLADRVKLIWALSLCHTFYNEIDIIDSGFVFIAARHWLIEMDNGVNENMRVNVELGWQQCLAGQHCLCISPDAKNVTAIVSHTHARTHTHTHTHFFTRIIFLAWVGFELTTHCEHRTVHAPNHWAMEAAPKIKHRCIFTFFCSSQKKIAPCTACR